MQLPGINRSLALPTWQEQPWLPVAVAAFVAVLASEHRNPDLSGNLTPDELDFKARCPICGGYVPLEKFDAHVKAEQRKMKGGQQGLFGQRGLFDNPETAVVYVGMRGRGGVVWVPVAGTSRNNAVRLVKRRMGREWNYHGIRTPAEQAKWGGRTVDVLTERRNPSFFTDEDGEVHPIRGTHGYDQTQTWGWIQQFRDADPEAFHELEREGVIRLPRQVARHQADAERQMERELQREYRRNFKVVRPEWAHGWSQADLEGLAEYADIPLYDLSKDDWADHVKPEEVSEYRDHYLSKRRSYGLPLSTRERLHRKARQVSERRSVTRSGHLARLARVNPSTFSFLFGDPDNRLSPATRAQLARAAKEQEKREHAAERRLKALELKLERARRDIHRLQERRPANARPVRLTRELSDAEIIRALDKGQARLLEHVSEGRIREALRRHGEAIASR